MFHQSLDHPHCHQWEDEVCLKCDTMGVRQQSYQSRCTTTQTTPRPPTSSLPGVLLKVGSFHRRQSKQRRLSDTIGLCLSMVPHALTALGTLPKVGEGCRRSQDY